jgi:hypothetical protein
VSSLFTMRTAATAVLALTLALGAGPTFAQGSDDVTVLLRSGERVAGRLEDLNNGTLFVRVTLHDQRRWPVSSVALIDYVSGAQGLPDAETRAARGNDHVLVMRNNQLVTGRLLDIEGGVGSDRPDERRVFVFRTSAGEERRVAAEQVARVYLGQFPGGPTGGSGGAVTLPESGTGVRVPANQRWTSTGMRVAAGQTVMFTVQGEVQLSSSPSDRATAAGSTTGRRAAGAPLPNLLAGALIGRIGNGAPFGIGNQASVPMPASGELFLGVNDDDLADNSGGFVVDVRPQAAPAPRRRR